MLVRSLREGKSILGALNPPFGSPRTAEETTKRDDVKRILLLSFSAHPADRHVRRGRRFLLEPPRARATRLLTGRRRLKIHDALDIPSRSDGTLIRRRSSTRDVYVSARGGREGMAEGEGRKIVCFVSNGTLCCTVHRHPVGSVTGRDDRFSEASQLTRCIINLYISASSAPRISHSNC